MNELKCMAEVMWQNKVNNRNTNSRSLHKNNLNNRDKSLSGNKNNWEK